MSLLDFTPDTVLAEINRRNGRALTWGEVEIIIDHNTSPEWLASQGLGNTMIRVIAKEGQRLYGGEKACTYNRMDINTVKEMLGGVVGLPDSITSVHAALPFFAARHGINFVPSDFEDSPVTWDGNGATFTLTVRPNSLCWMGSADFTSPHIAQELQSIIPNIVLPDYPVYRDIANRVFAETLVYNVDFTSHHAAVMDIANGNDDPVALMNLLNAATEITWNADQNAGDPHTTYGSIVSYNGINSGIALADPTYKYVMVVDMWADSTVIDGSLLIHYNDPA